MIVCAIETSGIAGSVALASDGRLLAEVALGTGTRHGQALIPALEAALAQAAVKKGAIDVFAAGIGPGSYTGIRVGLATAKTLAFTLKRPLIGIPSFDALAAALPAGDLEGAASLIVAADARRDRLYAGVYDPRTRARLAPLELRPAPRLFEGASEPVVLAGPNLESLPDVVRGRRFLVAHASAAAVARLAFETARRFPAPPLESVQPLYLRGGLSAEDESSSSAPLNP